MPTLRSDFSLFRWRLALTLEICPREQEVAPQEIASAETPRDKALEAQPSSLLREALRWSLWSLLLGLVVTWPLAWLPSLVSDSPNFPFHALLAKHVSHGGSPFLFTDLPYPEGSPTRPLGALTLLLAAFLNLVAPPVVALNLSLILTVALGAYVVQLLAASWGWRRSTQMLVAAAAVLAPPFVTQTVDFRFENVSYGAFALLLWALGQSGWRLLGGITLGLLWASIGSPYQAVPAGLLLLAFSFSRPWKVRVAAALTTLLVAAAVVAVFAEAPRNDSHGGSGRATASTPESLPLTLLALPMDATRGEARHRLTEAIKRPSETVFRPDHPSVWVPEPAYLGLISIVLGGGGLLVGFRDRRLRLASLAAVCCLLLALGEDLWLSPETPTGVPLPWRLIVPLPGVGSLWILRRFLTGVSFVLALGVGRLSETVPLRGARLLTLPVILLLASDGLLAASVNWPCGGSMAQAPRIVQQLTPSPIALWPPPPCLRWDQVERVVLLTGRPVSSLRINVARERLETPEHWLERARRDGARYYLQFDTLGCDPGPAPVDASMLYCYDGWCWSDLPPPGSPLLSSSSANP